VITGLLQDLPPHRRRRGVSRIGPATGQRPPAVDLLPHEQHLLALVEDHPAHVDLRCGVAGIAAEFDRELGRRPPADHPQQLGRQRAHLPVPVQVVVTVGEG